MATFFSWMARQIDAVSDLAGRLCAWCLMLIAGCITFEIAMRYVFTAPTVWVDEVSRILQVWVVYFAAAHVLKQRQMVTVGIILGNPDTRLRKLAESLALIVLFIFAGAAVWFGFGLWLKAALAGHTTDTYLAPPKWLTHAPVWVGGALLIAQGAVQLVRVWTAPLPADDAMDGRH